jgi:hypothetical protein
MIEIHPDLGEEIAELLVALRSYLDASGVDAGRYAVVPDGADHAAPYRFIYPMPCSYKTWGAQVSFPALDGSHVLSTDFSSARILLAALLTLDPEHRWERLPQGATPEDVLGAFGLSAGDYVFAQIPDRPDHTFLVPDRSGYAYGYLDVRPPAVTISRASVPAPVAVHLAMDRRVEAADLATALADHLPDFPE